MNTFHIQAEKQTQVIKKLQKRNDELQRFYDEYKRVCRNEEERIKELNCLYQVAQCVMVENDMDIALKKIACIVPNGWQFSEQACTRITFKNNVCQSPDFSESRVYQNENILIESQIVGAITVFYKLQSSSESNNPFLIEEKNLLKGIANIISFYLEKQKDNENRKIIQQQLLHSDRLATIGQLAAGVAHELN